MIYILIVLGLLVCALQAIRSGRLLTSALWLAGTSALTALLMYLLGSPEVAVIELSVGAGLVTVLFVFAINIAGEERLDLPTIVPRSMAWMAAILSVLLLGWMNRGVLGITIGTEPTTGFSAFFWNARQGDVFLQIVLIFTGVLSVLGLLADAPAHNKPAHGTPEKLAGMSPLIKLDEFRQPLRFPVHSDADVNGSTNKEPHA